MERTTVVSALRASEAFGALPESVIEELAKDARPVTLASGETLLREGDPADHVYLVTHGRLRAARTSADGDGVVGEISAGELVGELALLDDLPRSATVRAIRECSLLELSPEAVLRAMTDEPRALRAVVRRVLDRAAGRAPDRGTATTIAVLPAGDDPTAFRDVAVELVSRLARWGGCVLVTSDMVGLETTADLMHRMNGIEADRAFAIYMSDAEPTDWSMTCLRRADVIVLVGKTGPARNALEEHLFSLPPAEQPQSELVLVRGAGEPRDTETWLRNREVKGHHHTRSGSSTDLDRVARALAGRTIGVVFGGGGARGLAHFGVIDALDTFGVPLDSVGGTSIGAIVAATCGLRWDTPQRDLLVQILASDRRLLPPTLPLLSLSSSRRLTDLLRRPDGFGGGRTIEDMWLPFFCVSANLTRAVPAIHRRGSLWRALRASCSLPGFMPPVFEDGDLLVDGGVLDNLPVDVMRARQPGRIVAVDLYRAHDVGSTRPFAPDVSGWRMLGLRLRARKGHVPNALEIVMRAKDIGGLRAQRDGLARNPPDLLLNPPTGNTPLLDFRAAEPLIGMARDYALRVLDAHAERVSTWL